MGSPKVIQLQNLQSAAEIPIMKARVIVTLKNGVLDPQGKAIEGALGGLGFGDVGSVRQGKVFDVELTGTDKEAAKAPSSVSAAPTSTSTGRMRISS